MAALTSSAGAYLRQHREQAGLSIAAVARRVCRDTVNADAAAEALRNAEADRELLGDADLACLADTIGIDAQLYRTLAAPCR